MIYYVLNTFILNHSLTELTIYFLDMEGYCTISKMDCYGHDIRFSGSNVPVAECKSLCDRIPSCVAFNKQDSSNGCWLKEQSCTSLEPSSSISYFYIKRAGIDS